MKAKRPYAYFGSKATMAHWIIKRLPPHDHWIEVCGGSGVMTFAKPPSRLETFNDTWGEITNFWRVLQNPAQRQELIDRVSFTPYSRQEHQDALRAMRESTREREPVERAHAFFVTHQQGMGSSHDGWAFSAKAGNPRPKAWNTMPQHLKALAARFKEVQISNFDVLDCLQRFDKPGNLMFIDPPYLNETRENSKGAYVHDSFPHDEFLEACQRIQHARLLVTHYPHARYDEAFPLHEDFKSFRDTFKAVEPKIERLYRN